MTHLTTEQLQTIQAKANSMLDAVIERLEGSTQQQTAVRHVMQDSDDALSSFEQLAADEPAVAHQLLFSAGGALASLQTTCVENDSSSSVCRLARCFQQPLRIRRYGCGCSRHCCSLAHRNQIW